MWRIYTLKNKDFISLNTQKYKIHTYFSYQKTLSNKSEICKFNSEVYVLHTYCASELCIKSFSLIISVSTYY